MLKFQLRVNDENFWQRVREYAVRHQVSINQLILDLLKERIERGKS